MQSVQRGLVRPILGRSKDLKDPINAVYWVFKSFINSSDLEWIEYVGIIKKAFLMVSDTEIIIETTEMISVVSMRVNCI